MMYNLFVEQVRVSEVSAAFRAGGDFHSLQRYRQGWLSRAVSRRRGTLFVLFFGLVVWFGCLGWSVDCWLRRQIYGFACQLHGMQEGFEYCLDSTAHRAVFFYHSLWMVFLFWGFVCFQSFLDQPCARTCAFPLSIHNHHQHFTTSQHPVVFCKQTVHAIPLLCSHKK